MSEVKDDGVVDCNGDKSPARQRSTTTVLLLNTVLSSTTYGMSCAIPDNSRHVLCSHFNIDEPCDAKGFSGHTAILQMFLNAPTPTSEVLLRQLLATS